jgi:hypothetical protein
VSGGRRARQPQGVRKRGHKPDYWWDFNSDTTAIKVETTDPRAGADGVVEVFHLTGTGTAEAQIEMAERLIADLKAGRRKVA